MALLGFWTAGFGRIPGICTPSVRADINAFNDEDDGRRQYRLSLLARFVAARLAVARRDLPTARADLRLLIEGGHDGYEVRLLQGQVASRMRDRAA